MMVDRAVQDASFVAVGKDVAVHMSLTQLKMIYDVSAVKVAKMISMISAQIEGLLNRSKWAALNEAALNSQPR